MKRKEIVTIGSELKQILDQKGKTSYWLAHELGVSQSYLSKLFKDRFNPSYGLVKMIAETLGYEIHPMKRKKKGNSGGYHERNTT